MGIADSFGAGVNAINDMYRGQALRDQLQTYPDLLQAQLQQAQHAAGLSGVQLQYAPQMAQADLTKSNLFNQYYGPTQQANIGLTNAQAGQASANAGYIGTEAQKNQFLINNPGLMVPGIGGQIAGIGYLQQHDPAMFQGAPNSAPAAAPGNTPAPIAAPFNANGMTGLGGTPFSTQAPMPQPVQNPGGQMVPVSSPNMPPATGLGGSMFGGNPLANRLLQSLFAPMNKDLAQTQFYNAKAAQLAGQQNAGKNPMMGSNNSGAGGTYIDPTTGAITSTDTGAQTTRDQRTVAGLQNAQQYLRNVVQKMPQFVTGWQKVGLEGSGFANNWLGANYKSPSDYAGAEASLKSAAEGILNGFQLNSTGENVQTVIGIMKPVSGESSQYYQQRVQQQLADFSDQQHRAEDRLSSGINVGNKLPVANTQTTPSVTSNSNASPMVQIQGSDGRLWNIPENKLNTALARDKGAKRVS